VKVISIIGTISPLTLNNNSEKSTILENASSNVEDKVLKKRLTFIDFLRIIGISLVTFHHFIGHNLLLYDRYTLSIDLWVGINKTGAVLYRFDWGKVGVVLFLFASGLSLAYSNLDIDSWKKVKEFYRKRLLRIYPAYYLSLIFSIIIQPAILLQTFTPMDFIKTIFGMQALGATTEADIYGKINGPLWFLTPLIFLYIMFPFLAYAIRKRPHISIAVIFVINQVCLYLFSISNIFFGANWWFPLCLIFEFSLGIYLIRLGIYPKMESRNKVIIYLSNISFYLFLMNGPLLILADSPLIYVTSLLIAGTLFYKLNNSIKNRGKK
jgi:peptidoglycan/LPS O-acetylase OafA/YrhL